LGWRNRSKQQTDRLILRQTEYSIIACTWIYWCGHDWCCLLLCLLDHQLDCQLVAACYHALQHDVVALVLLVLQCIGVIGVAVHWCLILHVVDRVASRLGHTNSNCIRHDQTQTTTNPIHDDGK
jgi:hypothetical protein